MCVTGNYATTTTLQMSHFHISCAAAEKTERKCLKIKQRSPTKKSAQQEFPLHKRSCRTNRGPAMRDGDIPQCSAATSSGAGLRGSHPGIRWKDHTFRQLLASLADSSPPPHPPPPPSSPPAGSAVWSSHSSAASLFLAPGGGLQLWDVCLFTTPGRGEKKSAAHFNAA